MKNKTLEFAISDFKMDKDKGTFSCYGNIKGNIDHALDRTLNGAYQKSIDNHIKNGTMPKMFWMHKSHDLPVGAWSMMREDSSGLYMEGKMSQTTMGRDIEVLAKDGALDSFSIGYRVVKEQWNQGDKCNDLIELDIREVSWVTFACNDKSLLQSIKTSLNDGKLPSKADLREVLKTTDMFSKREIERITAAYNPVDECKTLHELLAQSAMFK